MWFNFFKSCDIYYIMGFFIYEIINSINNKRYVGCTNNTKKRKYQHFRELKKGVHKNGYLQNAYNKYGNENFKFKVTFKVSSKEEMYELERKIIKENDNLYNLAEGGYGGDTFSNRDKKSKDITRKKISKKSKIFNKKFRKQHSKNTKKLWENDEYREKVLKGVRKNLKENNVEYRKKLSEGVKKALKNPEILKKWSECKKGRKNANWSGCVEIYRDGKLIDIYDSITECQEKTGINRGTISSRVKNGGHYRNKNSKYYNCVFKLNKNI